MYCASYYMIVRFSLFDKEERGHKLLRLHDIFYSKKQAFEVSVAN